MLLLHVHGLKSVQVYIELPVYGIKIHQYVGCRLIIYPEREENIVVFIAKMQVLGDVVLQIDLRTR